MRLMKLILLVLVFSFPSFLVAQDFDSYKSFYDSSEKNQMKLKKTYNEYLKKERAESARYGNATENTALIFSYSKEIYDLYKIMNSKKFKSDYLKVQKLYDSLKKTEEARTMDRKWMRVSSLKVAYDGMLGSFLLINAPLNSSDVGFEDVCIDAPNVINGCLQAWDDFKVTYSELGDWLSKQK